MSKSTEYRGEPLKELEGKTHFVCECCQRRCSKSLSLDVHHIRPQAGGGNSAVLNARSNLAILDNSCHNVIHKIANSLASKKADKASAKELALEYATTVATTENINAVVSNLLGFATKVAEVTFLKKTKQLVGGDVTTNLDLPPQFNALYKVLAKTITDGNGKPIGKSRLTLMCVLTFIAGRYPGEKANEIQAYIFEHVLRSGKVKKHKSTGIVGRKL
jgi:hypothetical protein